MNLPQKFYVPRSEDLVVGVITKRLGECFRLDVGAAREGVLPLTAFNGATKQNVPPLDVGDFVLAGVANADKDHELMLSCVAADEVKTWSSKECYLGHLPRGMLFKMPVHLATLFHQSDCSLLHLLGQRIPYEVAIGLNGYCWIRAGTPKDTVLACQILQKCIDSKLQAFAELEEFFDNSPLVAGLTPVPTRL